MPRKPPNTCELAAPLGARVFGPLTPAPIITSLTPSPRDPTRIAVHGSPRNRRITTLHPREVESLGLAPGIPFTTALVERLEPAAALSASRWAALKLLNRRPMSTRDLIARLVARGTPAADAERIARDLESVGLLSDAAMAGAIVRATTSSRPAGESLLRHRLSARGIEQPTAEQAIADSGAMNPSAARAAAAKLAETTLSRLPAKLDPAARARRLLGVLSRRGFDEETAEHAARRAMGRDFPD